jgi:hypothetical protein
MGTRIRITAWAFTAAIMADGEVVTVMGIEGVMAMAAMGIVADTILEVADTAMAVAIVAERSPVCVAAVDLHMAVVDMVAAAGAN